MVEIEVDSKLFGVCPSLSEITMDDIPLDVQIEVRWENSKIEQMVVNHHKNRQFKLYVPDLISSERAAAALELPLNLDSNLVGRAKVALINRKLYDWRDFSKNVGTVVSKNLVLKMAADEIRKGNKPKLAYVVKDVFLDGVTPANADTLLRLRVLRGY